MTDKEWKTVQTYSHALEQTCYYLNATWYRWICPKCETILAEAAPCEWLSLDGRRREILGYSGIASIHEEFCYTIF